VLVRYATALDGRNWPLFADCFTADAVAEYANGRFEGYAAIEANCRRAVLPLDATQHLISNHVVDVAGDSASATCYLIAQHMRADAPSGPFLLLGAAYDDELTRTVAGWRIVSRRLRTLWTDGNKNIFEEARALSGWRDG
jgi:3-phenylpropionate/cinnamic acid dioxygenase small subunit